MTRCSSASGWQKRKRISESMARHYESRMLPLKRRLREFREPAPIDDGCGAEESAAAPARRRCGGVRKGELRRRNQGRPRPVLRMRLLPKLRRPVEMAFLRGIRDGKTSPQSPSATTFLPFGPLNKPLLYGTVQFHFCLALARRWKGAGRFARV